MPDSVLRPAASMGCRPQERGIDADATFEPGKRQWPAEQLAPPRSAADCGQAQADKGPD